MQKPAVLVIPPPPSDIDEFGRLDREIKLRETRRDYLKERFDVYFQSQSHEEPASAFGSAYVLMVTPCARKRVVNNPKRAFNALRKALGMEALIALFDAALGLIDKHVPESEQKTFITESRSGPRRMTVVALREPAAAAGAA